MTRGIYKLTFNGTDKVYIGQSTISIENRFAEHCYHLKSGKHTKKMNIAYEQFGLPSLHIVKECDSSNIDELENYYIAYYNSVDNGYNTLYNAGDTPKGTSIGEHNGKTKHTDEQIIHLMKVYYSSNISLKDAANISGVKYTVAIDIARGKTYTWLKDVDPIQYAKLLSKSSSDKYLIAVSPTGTFYTVTNLSKFCNEHNLHISNMSRLLRGKSKICKGWNAVQPLEK